MLCCYPIFSTSSSCTILVFWDCVLCPKIDFSYSHFLTDSRRCCLLPSSTISHLATSYQWLLPKNTLCHAQPSRTLPRMWNPSVKALYSFSFSTQSACFRVYASPWSSILDQDLGAGVLKPQNCYSKHDFQSSPGPVSSLWRIIYVSDFI